jgi:hypothetical protein
MNKKLASITMFGSRVRGQHVQMLVVILSLAMLVLGIGAPSDGGGAGG